MFQAFIIDFIGMTFRTLNFSSVNKKDNPLKMISFLVSAIFLICFTLEFVYQYYWIKKLSKKKKSEMTKFERDLSDIFFEGLNPIDVRNAPFVKFFNFFFTLKFMIIALLIFSMQYQ